MERKTKRLLSLLLALVMVISMIPATVFAEEAEDDPNTEGTEEYEAYIVRTVEEVETEVPFATLADAIANAVENEVVVLYKSLTVDTQIRVEKTITIDGAGNTLTRGVGLTTAMIYIPDRDSEGTTLAARADLTLENIILDGNKDNVTAGEPVISNRGGTLTLNNVTIQNAKGTSAGVAIYLIKRDISDVELIINSATIQNNETTGNGVIHVGAGADATVYNGTFTGNTAVNGGVFYIANGTADNTIDLTIHNGTFSGNKSTGTTNNTNGGGVVFLGSYNNLNVNGGIFGGDTADDGNTSATDGGVFYKASTTGETFITITKTGDVPLKFANNKSTKAGRMGGVFACAANTKVTLSVDGAEFTNNSATGSTATNAGALYIHNGIVATLENCTFTGNTAGNGGALFNSDTGTLTVTNCTFTENVETGTNGGGAVFVKGTVTINSSEFDGNQAAKGGAVYVHNQAAAKLNINGGTYTDNTATDSSDMYLTNGTTTITDEVKGVAITVATNAKQLNVSGTADLTDTVVTGKVAVAANGVLTVGGAFSATGVDLAAGAKLNVGTALTNNVALTSAVNEVGTVLVTAPAGELAAAVEKMTCDFGSDTLILSPETGAIYLTGYSAVIDGTGYETLADAIAAAQSGKTILLQANASDALVVIPAGVTLNLNGYVVDADYFAAFGSVIDTMATGGLEIAKGSATTMLREDNAYLPLYDTESGCYKFYAYELESVGAADSTATSAKFWFTVNFANEDAYALLADADAAGLYLTADVSWTKDEATTTVTAKIPQTAINDWYPLGSGGGVYVGVYGLDKVGEVTVTPVLKTSTAVNATGTAIIHDVAEEA